MGACRAAVPPEAAEEVPRFAPVVFFPPSPPVYGAPIREKPENGVRHYEGRRLVAPEGMAEFVGEYFYAALSTRMFAPDLGGGLEARLDAYRVRRGTLINALLDRLLALQEAPAQERVQQLRAFAAVQSPQIATLEAEAEEIRRELIADVLWNRIDWNAGRRWRLGGAEGAPDGKEQEAEFQVVRAAAYYEKGFTAAQRGLLRELAMELWALARKSRGGPAPRNDSDAMFFSPEMTRWRVPADLPATVRKKLAAYNAQKAALKRELREAVSAEDLAPPGRRAEVFAALADAQWPRFAALEELAEDIRLELAVAPEPAVPPAPPWLPAGLLESIRSYNTAHEAYYGELKHLTDRAAAKVPRPDLWLPTDERIRQQADYAARQAEARKQAAAEFQKANGTRLAALEKQSQEIRSMLGAIAEKQTDRASGRPLDADTLLRQYVASMRAFDTFGRETAIYAGYRAAMLQPGLSPAQRRLLFGHVLVGLAQPLPHGELMPRKTGKQPAPSW